VCQGPRLDALKSGISRVEKKDPTEIAEGFLKTTLEMGEKWRRCLQHLAISVVNRSIRAWKATIPTMDDVYSQIAGNHIIND
jgi:hypothetical protein